MSQTDISQPRQRWLNVSNATRATVTVERFVYGSSGGTTLFVETSNAEGDTFVEIGSYTSVGADTKSVSRQIPINEAGFLGSFLRWRMSHADTIANEFAFRITVVLE